MNNTQKSRKHTYAVKSDLPPFPLSGYLPPKPADSYVTEPARRVPVLAEVDVAVLGGGPAGACAATAAARMGASTLLVERYGFLGGTATAANVNIWHSLYGMDPSVKVIGGIPEEIIRRLQRMGAASNLSQDGETAAWTVHSESAKLAFDDMLVGSGAKLLLHSWLADVLVEDGRIVAAIVENKSGRYAIKANVFIDCTGDADLARRARLQTQLGSVDGGCQPPSYCFRIRGRGDDPVSLRDVQGLLFRDPMDYNGEHYPTFLWSSPGVIDPNENMVAGVRVLNINCSDAHDLTRAEIEGRYQLRWVLEKLRGYQGWEEAYLLDIATQIGLRESHRIIGQYQLQRDDVLLGRSFADNIAQGTYPIDIHNPRGPGIEFFRLDGTTSRTAGDGSREVGRWDGQPMDAPKRSTLCYQVPYRSLIARDLDNLLAAGRCIGANHDAAGAIRVMINAMQFGQAAGVAAALTCGGGRVRDVDVQRLRGKLMEWGMPLLAAK